MIKRIQKCFQTRGEHFQHIPQDELQNDSPTSKKIPSRISISLLCSLSLLEMYISRTNLSIAIVSMVRTVSKDIIHADTKRDPFCTRNMSDFTDQWLQINVTNFVSTNTHNIDDVPSIQMTSTERGNLLSAFFYAYGISGIIGGRLSELYGTKKVCGVALLIDSLANCLTPFISQANYWLFFSLRFTTGFFQGMCFPSITFLLSQWIPPDELTRIIGFVLIASNLGSAVTLIFGGFVISLLGWEYVFYISGSFSLLSLILWKFLMFDTPETHPRISIEEKRYITDALRERKLKKKPDKVPWLEMLRSLPIWAVNIAHAGSMCGLSFLVTQLPIYMSSIIGVNIRSNGLLSALPFIFRFIGSNVSSWLLYCIMKKCHWQLKTLRRVATSIALAGPAVSYLLVGYVGCSELPVILLFILGATLSGFSTSGYLCNSIDNTANFTGTARGIASTFAFFYSMILPVVIGALTPEETISEWRKVFWILFANLIGTGIFYIIFVSTDRQPWDFSNDDEKNRDEELKLTNSNIGESTRL